jgi:hypothetical protein
MVVSMPRLKYSSGTAKKSHFRIHIFQHICRIFDAEKIDSKYFFQNSSIRFFCGETIKYKEIFFRRVGIFLQGVPSTFAKKRPGEDATRSGI